MISIIPDIIAKIIAKTTYSALPGFANWLQEAEVIKAITATGPTARVLDVPNIAYKIKGIIEAYNPISAGKPANMAYASDWGISMMVTIMAAKESSAKSL